MKTCVCVCVCDLWLLTPVDTSTPTQEMTSHWPADIKLWITRVKDGGHQQRGRSIWRSSGGGLFKKGYYMIMGIWTKRWGALGRAGGEESTEKHWWAIFDKWRGSQHPSAPPSLVHLTGTCALHTSCTIPLSCFLLCPSQTRFLILWSLKLCNFIKVKYFFLYQFHMPYFAVCLSIPTRQWLNQWRSLGRNGLFDWPMEDKSGQKNNHYFCHFTWWC